MAEANVAQHNNPDTVTPNRAVLSGMKFIPSTYCQCPNEISADATLWVDFDKKSIDRDGLYLIEIEKAGTVEWFGCRRFHKTPDGLKVDWAGNGQWENIHLPDGSVMRVIGRVKARYTPE